MTNEMKNISLVVNGEKRNFLVSQHEKLLDTLRNASYFSVKSGCDSGSCGICTVLVDGRPVRSCLTKTEDVAGREVTTLEGLSKDGKMHPVQEAFVQTGAIQCGFCTPGLILSAKALLDKNPDPTEEEIRRALNGVICRCTGYVRAVKAVKGAAAVLRGEKLEPFSFLQAVLPENIDQVEIPEMYHRLEGGSGPLPPLVLTPVDMHGTKVVGSAEVKLDARKLALGKPVYTGDIHMEGMLHGALLTSPHAHARIRSIDADAARALPGVRAVLTHRDIPRIK